MQRPTTDEPPDHELLSEYRRDPEGGQGRRAAGALLARYRGRVYGWCHRMVRNHEEALDLAQAVMLKAWRSLPRFDGRSQFSSWMFMIARNECLTALRPKSLRRDDRANLEWLLVEHDEPGVLLETREEEEAMDALLRETLSPVEQEAIWLRCFERMSVEDITRLLGNGGASGARSTLQSAREKLRRALAQRRKDA
jgi:RNA polymerase sigma-70 factor (ECF subfamily)